MNETNLYIRRMFDAYYDQVDEKQVVPSSLENREIALVLFEKKGMFRHVGFLDPGKYVEYLKRQVPKHVYYSAARYRSPWKERMDEKGFFGCDLIFDIDCDHIDTPCKNDHDRWTCKECGETGRGHEPEKCPSCHSMKFDTETWLCDQCLGKSKVETIKLVNDFLARDLGIDAESVEILFSGHRGYHVHIESKTFRGLSSDDRREIADYITATGIKLSTLGFTPKSDMVNGFTIDDIGWRGRITRVLERMLKEPSFAAQVVDANLAKLLEQNNELLLERISSRNLVWSVPGINMKNWTRIINQIISHARSEIDVPVTIDLHRLIRAPGTLHGKSGFRVMEIPRERLDKFDPFDDPVVFKGPEEMITIDQPTPAFRIGNESYGPFEPGEKLSVPLEAAMYLMCKGKASVLT